jgi:subtilisin-like proprotein convertase family protein
MTSKIALIDNFSYSYSFSSGTVQLKATKIENIGDATSGTVRLELWLTPAPWSLTEPNPGYQVATYTMSGPSNGTLAPHATFENLTQTVPITNYPPAGTYFVTMVASEYTGQNLAVNNGYVVGDYGTFPKNYLVIASNGFHSQTPIVAPIFDIESVNIWEKDLGTQAMEFTVTLSEAQPFPTTVQFDTDDETAFDGYDYQGVHKTLTFAAGVTSVKVTVPVKSNADFQSYRAFGVTLSHSSFPKIASQYVNADGYTVSGTSAWGLIKDDDWPDDIAPPTDPNIGVQWYLLNTRTEYAWEKATGKGIKVGIFDQGIDAGNPDLAANVSLALGINAATTSAGGAPLTGTDNHGTQVAGIIAATKDTKGIVGVAYNATLVSIYSPLKYGATYITEITNAFNYAKTLDVLNNSWGFGNLLSAGTNWAFLDNAGSSEFAPAFKALKELASEGRKGLGTIVVQSAGNGYDFGDDTNLHNFQNSRYVITVGATDYLGASSYFSTTGASILVAAPGGAGSRDYASILTTDRLDAAGSAKGNLAFVDGTSFSSPIVAGIVAMMLELNPKLGYRDVQKILAYTAHHTALDYAPDYWATNGAIDWNGGGMRYDNVVQASGFGVVDALAAVRLAASWDAAPLTAANTLTATASKTVNAAIPDNGVLGLNSVIDIKTPLTVERVDVTVNILHPFIGDLQIVLTSPTGTKSYLMYRPAQGSLSAVGSSQKDIHFTFDTVLSWGEQATGQWRLNVRDLKGGDVGTLVDWSIELIGHAESKDQVFVFTNEYPELVAADAARGVLSAPGGANSTINASVLGLDNKIDLSGLSTSVLNGAALRIAAGTTIRNAVGGDGDDLLIANAAGSILRGMDGNDTLTGGAGFDTLEGGIGTDILSGAGGIDKAVYKLDFAAYQLAKTTTGWTVKASTGNEGTDVLASVERLQFHDKMVALDYNGVAGQAYRIYQAAFNRTPDGGGLGFWLDQMDKGMSLNNVALYFVQSNEFKQAYGEHPASGDIVNRFYQNVLHRAPDAAGAAFWTDILDQKRLSTAEVLSQFSESAENQAALIGVIENGISYLLS